MENIIRGEDLVKMCMEIERRKQVIQLNDFEKELISKTFDNMNSLSDFTGCICEPSDFTYGFDSYGNYMVSSDKAISDNVVQLLIDLVEVINVKKSDSLKFEINEVMYKLDACEGKEIVYGTLMNSGWTLSNGIYNVTFTAKLPMITVKVNEVSSGLPLYFERFQ